MVCANRLFISGRSDIHTAITHHNDNLRGEGAKWRPIFTSSLIRDRNNQMELTSGLYECSGARTVAASQDCSAIPQRNRSNASERITVDVVKDNTRK
jgi:hypothetical protein